jgi:hypothetical protein
MKTFIRVAEIWVPTGDRTQLRLADGLYGALADFREASNQVQFAFNEGLPGRAWAAGHPIILKQFERTYFERVDAAKAAGLTCAVALPVFIGDYVLAVVVFFCSEGKDQVGAIELWRNDPEKSNDLRLVDGCYGAAETFEFNARHTKFPRGYGLPGRAWKANMPLIVKDLVTSKTFLRREQAADIGINKALGIPYGDPSSQFWVLTFLSARNTPIARRFEIWAPNEARDALIFHAGDCDQNTRLTEEYASAAIAKGEGAIGRVWLTGIPAVREGMPDRYSLPERSAATAGLDTVLAVPMMEAARLKAVVAWYF